MRNIPLITGALAMALAAPAIAQNNGHGGDKGKGHAAGEMKAAKGKDRGPQGQARMPKPQKDARAASRGDNGNGNGNGKAWAKAPDRPDRALARDVGRVIGRTNDRDAPRYSDDRRVRDQGREYYRRVVEGRAIIDGCPPGLAKKNNGCLPPGQAKKLYQRDDRYAAMINGIPYRYRDIGQDYRYRDGYLYRTQNDGISSWLPLLGGALGVGEIFPQSYAAYPMPDYYRAYYGRDDDARYLYADRAIFAVDPETRAIESIAALLTGDDWTVGQPMPQGYGVYNVPLAYRDRYYDTNDANYRYSDGHVYKIDPKTQLVAAAISLLS